MSQNPILVLLQCLLLALYLILLSVLYLIQLGSALFFLMHFAIMVFLMNDLLDPICTVFMLNIKNVRISNPIHQITQIVILNF